MLGREGGAVRGEDSFFAGDGFKRTRRKLHQARAGLNALRTSSGKRRGGLTRLSRTKRVETQEGYMEKNP
ncbi:hypothetical protein E2320_005376 [Naja naja]|nr:hypothetical protein E2320_005376 [Naja naja]